VSCGHTIPDPLTCPACRARDVEQAARAHATDFIPEGYRYVRTGACRCGSPDERLVVRAGDEHLGPAAWVCPRCARKR
jgi:hypothetical protein